MSYTCVRIKRALLTSTHGKFTPGSKNALPSPSRQRLHQPFPPSDPLKYIFPIRERRIRIFSRCGGICFLNFSPPCSDYPFGKWLFFYTFGYLGRSETIPLPTCRYPLLRFGYGINRHQQNFPAQKGRSLFFFRPSTIPVLFYIYRRLFCLRQMEKRSMTRFRFLKYIMVNIIWSFEPIHYVKTLRLSKQIFLN